MKHLELGRAGEEIAADYLIKNGFGIVDRNVRWKKGEIDLICSKADQLVIVEVKTRTTDKYGSPVLAISRKKQRQLIDVADHYVKVNNCNGDVRFDVVSIIHNTYSTEIDHIEGAFTPFA